MTKQQILKHVKFGIREGRAKQEIYEELKLMSSEKPERIAKLLQSVPSQVVVKKYVFPQILLLVFLAIYILGYGFLMYTQFKGYVGSQLLWSISRFIVGLYILTGVATHSMEVYQWGRFWMLLGLIRFTALGFLDGFYWFLLLDLGLYFGIVGLLFYLYPRLFPPYRLLREIYQNPHGEDRLRYVINFD